MVCCTSAIPVLLGLSEKLHRLLGGASLVFSCLNSIFLTSGEQPPNLPCCISAAPASQLPAYVAHLSPEQLPTRT
jgi:hypothetical protein